MPDEIRYSLELVAGDMNTLYVHIHPPLVYAHRYDPDEPVDDICSELRQSLLATQMFSDVMCYPFYIWLQRSPNLRWLEIYPHLYRVLEIELARGDRELHEFEPPHIVELTDDDEQFRQPVEFVHEEDWGHETEECDASDDDEA